MPAASPTFHGFLQPSDASPGSVTPSSGSSSPEMFFDAADQLHVTHMTATPIHHGKGEHFHDAQETPSANTAVYIEDCKEMQGFGRKEQTKTEARTPYGVHSDTSDAWSDNWAGQSHDFFHNHDRNEKIKDEAPPQSLTKRTKIYDSYPGVINPGSNARLPAADLPEPHEDQKPKARRILTDFLPQKQTGSNLREETRKIVQMLSNDKTCKIDRPSLGLQDRLQSLVQRSAGKRTSYVKGPRVCSTLVKLIVKRTQDSIHLRRGSFQGCNNKQEDKPPLPAFNKPIQSYIKPSKHSKVSGSDNAPSTRDNHVNDTGFELIIKRQKKDADKVLNEETDSRTSVAVVSTTPNLPAGGSITTSSAPDTTTTTPVTSQITAQHTSQSCLDPGTEKQTTGSTHKGGENIHVSTTVDLFQDTHGSPRESLINVEFKVSVPYRSRDQDTPDCTDHRPSFPGTLLRYDVDDDNDDGDDYDDDDDDDGNSDYDDDDDGNSDYDGSENGDYDAPSVDERKITSDKYQETESPNGKHNEIKSPAMKKVTTTHDDLDEMQDSASVNLTNGHNQQKDLSSSTRGNKLSPSHSSTTPAPPHQQEGTVTNSAVDLQQHIASLNKTSLKFGVKNKEHESDKNAAVPRDLPVSGEKHSTLPTTQSTASDTHRMTKVSGKESGGRATNSSLPCVGPRFCLATAIENVSLPSYKGGEAMLRNLSYSDTPQASQRRISTRDLLYSDEEKQQTSALPQSALHSHALVRLKTDNLVARHGGKKTHVQPYPISPRQTPATTKPDHAPIKEETPESIPVESLPPIPPNTKKAKPASVSRQGSKEEAGAEMDRRRSKAGGARSRNTSLEHSCLGSRRGSKKPSFSQDMLRKCLLAAVDQCYNTEWEEASDSEVVKDDNMSQEELNRSLVKAISRHDADKVRVLLKLGADPNVKCGSTPALLRAAREGALYVMQALLAAGADVDVRTDIGNSPLHLAARSGYGEAVIQLVHSGAFVDAINRSGVTPLQVALAHGHLDVAHSLLRLKADMLLQNKVGESAYDVANELGYIELSGAPREIRRDSGVGTKVELPHSDIPVAVRMIQGIEAGCAGTVDDCLREGASPNTRLPLALHWPAHASVLHRAAHHGHDLVVRLLLAAGADINMRDVVGNTSLHVAAQAGHNRVVKILLGCGAALEAVSQSGMTPLHRAASKGKELTCNLLVRRGSNQQAEDSSGRTPADWARKRGYKHLSQKLMYRRKSSSTLLAEGDDKQCLEHLHRLHEAALKAPHQSPEPMDCEE